MKDKIIISLTTIPSRINFIEPVIDSLCKQVLKPNLIYINIPKKYNRFGKCPEIPTFLKMNKKVIINYLDTDYGPGTKFIGTLSNNEIKDNDIIVITDDDTIKERHWLSGLLIYYKYDSIIAYEEKNLGKGVVWGYLGYAFRKGIFNLNKMLEFYKKVKDKCILVDDHWLTAYCHYMKHKIHTVSIKRSYFVNSGSISGEESLVNLEGKDSRWYVSENCRKHIKDTFNLEFPFWCCMGCCKKGVRKTIFEENSLEKFANTKNNKYVILVLIAIVISIYYCSNNLINFDKKKYVIIAIMTSFLIFTLFYKNVENFGLTTSSDYQPNESDLIPPIPKILIQTYYDKRKIPKKVYDNLKKYAPDYKHIIYDDNECEEFFKKYFNPNILLTFRKLKGAHKADLFRYCYLYKFGGVYLDIKTELIKPLKEIFPNNYTYSVLSINQNTIYQGIIATPPGNPLFLKLIYFMVKLVEKRTKFPYIIFTIDFFHKIYDYCDKKPEAGLNIGKKGFNYYLYVEKCSKNKNKCYDGLDRYGLCCFVYDGKTKMIKSRYSDFPW